jgi:hypothetical protein
MLRSRLHISRVGSYSGHTEQQNLMLTVDIDSRKPVHKAPKAKAKPESKFDQVASAAAMKESGSMSGKQCISLNSGHRQESVIRSPCIRHICTSHSKFSASMARSNAGCHQTLSPHISPLRFRPGAKAPLLQPVSLTIFHGAVYLSCGWQVYRTGPCILAAVFSVVHPSLPSSLSLLRHGRRKKRRSRQRHKDLRRTVLSQF